MIAQTPQRHTATAASAGIHTEFKTHFSANAALFGTTSYFGRFECIDSIPGVTQRLGVSSERSDDGAAARSDFTPHVKQPPMRRAGKVDRRAELASLQQIDSGRGAWSVARRQ
jgi:hypothetical protein